MEDKSEQQGLLGYSRMVLGVDPVRDYTSTTNSDTFSDMVKDKFVISNCATEKFYKCMECRLNQKSKYLVVHDKQLNFICGDACLNYLKEKHANVVIRNNNNKDVQNEMLFQKKCVECKKEILDNEVNLSWELMEFCKEICLSKYQKRVGEICANCKSGIRTNLLGKYCVCFGDDIQHFCNKTCLDCYKKRLELCKYCQRDLIKIGGFWASRIGNGQFPKFCTQQCMQKHKVFINYNKKFGVRPYSSCTVCLSKKPIMIVFEDANMSNLFCGDPCFVAFKFVNNIAAGKCDICCNAVNTKILEENSIRYNNAQHSFCSKGCQNFYLFLHRKLMRCSCCTVRKYDVDMIKKHIPTGSLLSFCSLYCLNLNWMAANPSMIKKLKCDYCNKTRGSFFPLTRPNGITCNFCSYVCMKLFQRQVSQTIALNECNRPVPVGIPVNNESYLTKNAQVFVISATEPALPAIGNTESQAIINIPASASSQETQNRIDHSDSNSVPPIVKKRIKERIIIKPAPIPEQVNVSTMCKPVTATKATSSKPSVTDKEVQTDEAKTAIVPIPVPIQVPAPMCMYSLPFPVPLPTPVPIFIPTTRNSASGIMKEIKKIQDRMPSDPREVDLLVMARMIAGANGEQSTENTDFESDKEGTSAAANEDTVGPEPVDANDTSEEDILQTEPDLDVDVTFNYITIFENTENSRTR